ncbi:MAG: hypothetical protein ABW048_10980 [Sphingobium sp.]
MRRARADGPVAAKGSQREETRARLIAAASLLLVDQSLIELTAIDIAATAGFSNATFYIHFKDPYEAVYQACKDISQSPPHLLATLCDPWTTDTAEDQAVALIDGYFQMWDAHRPLLRARNLAAEEGDERFKTLRQNAVAPLAAALHRQIEWGQAGGRVARDIDAGALANSLLALMERTGAVQHEYEYISPQWHDLYVDAVIHALLATLGFPRIRNAGSE